MRQLAIARQTGFASWPKLSLHVETLRGLEGTWHFESLEVAGSAMDSGMLAGSRILIDGDKFRSESAGTIYEGVFAIDVEPKVPTIDIHFAAGPEAGNVNLGIFRLGGNKLEICLETTEALGHKNSEQNRALGKLMNGLFVTMPIALRT